MNEDETHVESSKVLRQMVDMLEDFLLKIKGQKYYHAHIIAMLSSLVGHTLAKIMLTNLIAPPERRLQIGDGHDLKRWLFIFNNSLDQVIVKMEEDIDEKIRF